MVFPLFALPFMTLLTGAGAAAGVAGGVATAVNQAKQAQAAEAQKRYWEQQGPPGGRV